MLCTRAPYGRVEPGGVRWVWVDVGACVPILGIVVCDMWLGWILFRGVYSYRVVAREILEVVDPYPLWICVELRDRAATAWARRLEFLEFPLFWSWSSRLRVEGLS
jgi:hypothetical protein